LSLNAKLKQSIKIGPHFPQLFTVFYKKTTVCVIYYIFRNCCKV